MSTNGRTEARKIHDSLEHNGARSIVDEKYGQPALIEAVRGVEDLDDYAACKIEGKGDFNDLFVKRYYFGCEADGPINGWAFRDFIFENAVRFWGEVNPDFFKGTVVSSAAAEVLARGR